MEDLRKYNPDGSELRKAQMRMLDILREVDKIFRRNNITYWVDAGTLLGTVRHHGFIPWDDDVDVSVPLKEYTKAREALIRELPSAYVYVDAKTDKNYFDSCGRVKSVN
jgi:lipopolysaccharide cholinephosphotransferase